MKRDADLDELAAQLRAEGVPLRLIAVRRHERIQRERAQERTNLNQHRPPLILGLPALVIVLVVIIFLACAVWAVLTQL